MNKTIPYSKPSITSLEIELMMDAVKFGWGEDCYRYLHRFEAEFASHINAYFAIATSSCTGALTMGLAGIGVGPGDEVILADTNWVATVAPIVQLGADPVFVDILEDTWCISPEMVEAAITPRTKAIIATHLYGNLCDMEKLLAISNKTGVKIIEDAAEAIGSVYHGKPAGSLGDFGVFSFHGTKTLSTGEGGMFVTNDSALYERVRLLSNHGRSSAGGPQFWPEVLGYKYKMTNIQAAMGCAQISRVDELVSRKREIFNFYREELKELDYVSFNAEHDGTKIGAWMPNLVFSKASGIRREYLLEEFQKAGIDARVFFWPLTSTPPFNQHQPGNSPVSYSTAKRSINLPSYHEITQPELDRVVRVVKRLKVKTG